MQSPHDCPRCATALTVGEAATFVAHGCARCGGMWVDNDSLALLSKATGDSVPAKRALKLAKFLSSGAATRADTEPDDLPCPRCSEPMLRTRMHDAWIDVDLCSAHGTWFDRGEIEQFARALAQPAAADWRNAPAPLPAASAASVSRPADSSGGQGAQRPRTLGAMLEAVTEKLEQVANDLVDEL